eukprot:428185-Rhodomonas_salina.3
MRQSYRPGTMTATDVSTAVQFWALKMLVQFWAPIVRRTVVSTVPGRACIACVPLLLGRNLVLGSCSPFGAPS